MRLLIQTFGLCVILALCWALSTNRRRIDWRLVGWGLALQFAFAVLVLKTRPGQLLFSRLNDGALKFLDFCQEGSRFVFGDISDRFAFGPLASVIVFASIIAMLYHLRVMQWVVWSMAVVMKVTLRTRGAETLSAAANVFLGQTEAPLLVKPYLSAMTKSELLAIMVGGMANISGGTLAAYVGLLGERFPGIAGHLLAASVMSAPASLVIAKMLMPQEETGADELANLRLKFEKVDANLLDAAARGASEGKDLVINVVAMLIAAIALVAILNYLWGAACAEVAWATNADLTAVDSFQKVLGYGFAPFAWLMGCPGEDCLVAGTLLGEKTVLNEFIAYAHFSDYLQGKPVLEGIAVHELHERTKIVLAYALCGFANFASIGILLGGMGAMAPDRRGDLARLGLRALLGGTLATFMTATIAAMLL